MMKHKNYLPIAEFCEKNGIQRYKFYRILHRHPELARKIRTSTSGERLLDEKSMKTAKSIFRKEKYEERKKLTANSAANEINIMAVQIDELREAVKSLRCENDRLKKFIREEKRELRENKKIFNAVYGSLGRAYLQGDEKKLGEYLTTCDDFKIFMDS